MNKRREKRITKNPDIQKDNILQAVVVTDSFNKNFMPACSFLASLPVVNKSLIDRTLEWLNCAGVNEVILLSSSNTSKIKQYVKDKQFLNIDVKVLVSEDCCTFGDVMRALDRYAVIQKNFILLSIDIIGNINFLPVFEKFKKIQERDKGAVMMMLCKAVGRQRKDLTNQVVIAGNSEERVIAYQVQDSKTIDIPMETLLQYDFIDVHKDLMNCGVAICSMAVPLLFTENFDFQTLHDFIRGLLINEEILQSSVYYHSVDENQYIAKISDWPMYQIISQDIIRRWTYPMVLDISDKYSYRKNSVYLKNVTISKDCKLISDVVIGDGTKLHKNVYIDGSVIGRGCCIGDNVRIENSYIFDDVRIDSDCVISYSVIAEKAHIKKNVTLENNCIIGPGDIVSSNKSSEISAKTKTTTSENSDSDEDESPGLVVQKLTPVEEADGDSSSEGSSRESCDSPIVMDDVKVFYGEVLDSLTRGYEDKLKCEHLILEINSSRYAYNVTVSEVNYNLICAILNINYEQTSDRNAKDVLQQVVAKLNYFLPILRNYIKNDSTQQDCLSAIEDIAWQDKTLMSITPKILHFMYVKNILNEEQILSWHLQVLKNENGDFKKTIAPFITWLIEADEESEEDSSE